MKEETFCKQDGKDLKEYILDKIANVVTLITGNDQRYAERFKSLEAKIDSAYKEQKEAVATALLAQEKAVNTAFSASDKAIIKAEDAQKDYNNRSNEFRGQLDDQAKMLMPRIETIGLFKGADDKMETIKKGVDDKMETLRLSMEKMNDSLMKEIASLRESRSGSEGKDIGAREMISYIIGAIGIILGLSRFIK